MKSHDKPYEHYPKWGEWGRVQSTAFGRPYQERTCMVPGCKAVDRRYR